MPSASLAQDLRQIARVADVGIEIDLLAIFRDRRDTADLFQGGDAQFFFFLFLLHAVIVSSSGLM